MKSDELLARELREHYEAIKPIQQELVKRGFDLRFRDRWSTHELLFVESIKITKNIPKSI